MENFFSLLLAGLLSGSFISAILAFIFLRRTKQVEAEIKSQYDKSMALFQSNRLWKEKSISELLGPIYVQFDRTNRAFTYWNEQNLFLEAKVIMAGNLAIRDLLLSKIHLLPMDLWGDAGKLIEHYDRWLEEFDRLRNSENPDLKTKFVFVGPKGFPFPKEAERHFKEKFTLLWAELYGDNENDKR